jgi:arylsulfatase A-like enzyme/lipoprotein NlpI
VSVKDIGGTAVNYTGHTILFGGRSAPCDSVKAGEEPMTIKQGRIMPGSARLESSSSQTKDGSKLLSRKSGGGSIHHRGEALMGALCALAGLLMHSSAVQGQTPPPVILISVDTLRADHLSSYGYQHLRTPNIDAIAQGGTLFSQVSAQVPLTMPSHASLFTSTYPFANGVQDNGEQLPADSTTLTTVLKSRGYKTGGFVGSFILDRRFGLDQGFDFYDSPFDLHRHAGTDLGEIKRLGQEVVAAAEEWLDRNADGPFFLFLHLFDLHTPYNLPPALGVRYGTGYDGELAYVDAVLADFWKYLAARGLIEKSLIVFVSDHGESLGDHGESTHGYFIYESTIRVPIIIHWPIGAALFPSRVDQPVKLLDVAPTILQFIGVPRPTQFQGRSLLGLLTARTSLPRDEICSESLYAHRGFGTSALRSLRFGAYKYIEAPRPEFYDLTRDPQEAHNLYSIRRALALTYRDRLQALRARFRPKQSTGPRVLSPEAAEALTSLGYVAVSSARTEATEQRPDPKDRIADYEQYGKALILASTGQLTKSNARLRSLLTKDPGLISVRMSLGANLQRVGQHREAIECFREVAKYDPLNVLAHFNLGVSQYALRDLDGAIRELEAALALAPYYTRADELLGTIWIEKKDMARARRHFEHILAVAPRDYAGHHNLGVLALMGSRWEEGERHLLAALEADPDSAEAHNSLGSLFLQRGDLGAAREEFQKAVSLQPNFAWAHYNLGLVYRREHKNEAAAQAFRSALAADRDFAPARQALERLAQIAK